jgi:hypothetical protein
VGYLRSLGEWEETLHAFQQKHGALAEYVAPTLDEIVRRDGLAALRNSVTEVEHRFFLALLLNVPSRAEILGLVAQRFPGAPVETILRWAEELTETSETSTWILDAEFPAELAIPSEKQPEVFLLALRCFLEPGKTGAGSGSLSPADLEQLRHSLSRSSLRALVS